MPHDRKGTLLQMGDKVFIPATITHIQPGRPEYCNCTVELDELMPPDNTKTTFQALNTRQLERCAEQPAPAAATAEDGTPKPPNPPPTGGSNDDPPK